MNAAVKERPILFSAPMVRAILSDAKTQTRRVVKPQPAGFWDDPNAHPNTGLNAIVKDEKGNARHKWIICPYGQPSDRLWVRETFVVGYLQNEKGRFEGPETVWYRATTPDLEWNEGDDPTPWKPSIHMPRKHCRILLEVVSVRVERLQDISEEDAIAEGIAAITVSLDKQCRRYRDYSGAVSWGLPAIESYRSLWEYINGAGSWDRNDWVWVVEFKRVEAGNAN